MTRGYFDLADLVRDLVPNIIQAYTPGNVSVEIEVLSVLLPSAFAAPASLILNELLANAAPPCIISSSGGEVVGLAGDYASAIDLVQKHAPDLALIDIYLDDGPTGLDLAKALAKDGRTRFVFTSANRSRIPQNFEGAVGAIDKPYTEKGLKAALGYLQKGLLDPPPDQDLPPSLRLSPSYVERWR